MSVAHNFHSNTFLTLRSHHLLDPFPGVTITRHNLTLHHKVHVVNLPVMGVFQHGRTCVEPAHFKKGECVSFEFDVDRAQGPFPTSGHVAGSF